MFPTEVLKQCWFLAGPTAGGKTATALEISRRIDAEIVSMDSMAVYRHMDIGTAKPTPEECGDVPHHLINVVDPHEEFSVTDFLSLANVAAQEILSRDRIPLFVGGTGLYLRSMLRGVYEGPDADWKLRTELDEFAEKEGNEALHQQLKLCDPATAARLHPNDRRRVIRAIEVHRATGEPLSDRHTNRPLKVEERPPALFWIHPPRPWLHERINLRVDLMMAQGLLQETQTLLNRIPPIGRTARQGLGYRELIDYLEGNVPLNAAVEQIKIGTRQFAKRQHTWFRNIEEVTSIEVRGDETPSGLAARLIDRAGERS